ncbi:SusC/RagA family TonB-linked outer membrane protein [Confluentibacter flavum]|uniref:SusC/RagA family TonB-linked outer membrane protein n=1 Tax=Confluentibacter flavum TaxID=1909700 RepID=A0A2N3HGX3_9FLAO|nr:SusC/RagA family TonB-linked outer membrane protein [Confluentibacter flavum]PKQ44215.1 SusC/RagA family TonB-linked outer membrane protein [Confluentibacter flavum]
MKNIDKTIYRNSLFLVFYLLTVPSHATTLSPLIFHANSLPSVAVQQSEVHGTITDTQGLPLAGVAISVKGTQKGTVSDFNGFYTIKVDANETLVFSFIGFKTHEIAVQGRNELNLVLETDITALSTVEINAGYYTVNDRERTGNISRITAKEIETQPVANPLSALQGRMPGVYIQQRSGVPGGGFIVRIRGQNSITKGNDPLYIVDGVPFISSTLASLGTEIVSNANPLSSINPSDIESVEVLKDADATAIYGSRGANGVVLITTKRGKVGKTEVSFDFQSGVGSVANRMDLLNTSQYLEMRQEAFINDGVTPTATNAPDLLVWNQQRYTDWQDTLIGGTSYISDAQVKVSGGSEHTQFLAGASAYKETTVIPGDFDYKRFSFNSAMNHRSENDRFTAAVNIMYAMEDSGLPNVDLTYSALTLPPNTPELLDDNGDLVFFRDITNPLIYTKRQYEAQNTNFIANAQFAYQIFDGLKLGTSIGYNNMHRDEIAIRPSSSRNPASTSPQSSDFADTKVSSWIMEPQLEYQKTWGDLSLKTLVGATIQQNNQSSKTLSGSGYSNDALMEDLAAAASVTVLRSSQSEYKYQAVYGRLNLGFKERYYVNLTGRRDGSSRFGPENRFANFGAVGLAWIVSEEPIFEAKRVFSYGKVRASYGTTGNDQIGDYGYLDTYSPTSYAYQGVSGLYPTRLYNSDFGWERNKKFETAMDLGFFRDRLMLSLVYYNNRSDNQLIGLPLPLSTGFSNIQSNLNATVENSGWEFNLETININTEHFTWKSSLNLSIPKTKLVRYPDLETSVHANRYRVGQSLFVVPAFHSTGVNPDTGIYGFEDVDMDGAISIPNDYQFLQDIRPEFYGGFLNSIRYKRLTLDCLLQFNKELGLNYLNMFFYAPGNISNQSAEVLDRWQEPGDVAAFQKFTQGFNQARTAYTNTNFADNFYQDIFYIRIKNVNLSYSIPTERLPFTSARLYIQGQNLFTITDYKGLDPEGGVRSLPPLRVISLGLQCSF